VGILAAVAALLLAVGLVHHATTSSGHPVTVTAIPLQRASTTPAPRAAAAVPPAKSVLDTVCVANPAGQKLLVVSISKQQMWACAGTKVVSDSPVTTGAPALSGVNDATPTGTWHVVGETTNTYLNGCDASGCWHDFVHYWMPFDGAVGFHDASWQTFPFGSPDYLTGGSHGCVHLPESEMSWVYGWAAVGTTVTVDA
jgi:lipoprotein-anchoring transpeptidase ErfK/SrfK